MEKLSEFNYLNSEQYNAISSISQGYLFVWSIFPYCKSIDNFDMHQSNSLVFPFWKGVEWISSSHLSPLSFLRNISLNCATSTIQIAPWWYRPSACNRDKLKGNLNVFWVRARITSEIWVGYDCILLSINIKWEYSNQHVANHIFPDDTTHT